MTTLEIACRRRMLVCLVSIALGVSAWAAGHQYSAYRSFLPSPEMTGRFAELGVTVRGFGVCNTYCGDGSRLYSDPITWTGIGQYDWTGVDTMVTNLMAASPSAKFIACVDLNTPEWLAKRSDGDSFNTIGMWATNETWRTTTKAWLAECLGHLEAKYGDRMLAYVLMAGQTTEWFQNYTPPAALGMSSAAFENQIYDPTAEKAKIDHWRAHNRNIADALLDFAHAAKAQLPAAREIGAFFGYYNVCNGNWAASGGHLDYERVAASDDIDFFISPTTYAERGMGCGAGSMAVNGTLRRHGKRILHEIDCRTSAFDSPLGGISQWANVAEDVAGITRETAFALINGCSWWWFDLFTTNNFSGSDVQTRIRRLQTLRDRFSDSDPATDADVLMVCDPETELNCVENGKANACGDRFRNKLNRTGLMYDVCSFGDLAAIDLSKYRFVCLPATWVITAERATVLNERVCCGGRTVLWSYAPGVSDGSTLDSSRVATWAGVAYGTSGLVTTDRGDWKAVYRADPAAFTVAELRAAGLAAGCHAWTDEALPVAANPRLVAVHAATAGARTIHFKSNIVEVADVLTGVVVARGAADVTLNFSAPETKVLELRSAVTDDPAIGGVAISNVVPSAFLEYVQTCGDATSGQFFDVGFTPTDATEIEMDFAYTELPTATMLFCARGSNTADRTFSLSHTLDATADKGAYRFDCSANKIGTGCEYLLDAAADIMSGRTHLQARKAGLRIFGCDADGSEGSGSFTAGGRLMLLGSYFDGFESNRLFFASVKLYRTFIREGETLVRDLMPARYGAATGLWDRVNGVFYGAGLHGTAESVTGGAEIATPTVSLRDDVLAHGGVWASFGSNALSTASYGSFLGHAQLFDGVGRVGYQGAPYSDLTRWLANDVSVQGVRISGYDGRGTLTGYALFKPHFPVTGCNSRAPTAWRLEGIPSGGSDWIVIDERSDVVWPGACECRTDGQPETPPSVSDCELTFTVPAARQTAYSALRFVPTSSWLKVNSPSSAWPYSVCEIEFRVCVAPYSPELAVDAYPVDYIASTNGNTYIDTDICPIPAETRMRVDVVPTDLSQNSRLFGARGWALGCDGTACNVFNIAGSGLRMDWIGTATGASYPATAGRRYVIDCCGSRVAVTDLSTGADTELSSVVQKDATGIDYSLWLLSFNNAGQSASFLGTPQRLYGAKVWRGGTALTANYFPWCVDGVAKVYDAVSKAFLSVSGPPATCNGAEIVGGGADTLLVCADGGVTATEDFVPGLGTLSGLRTADTVTLSAPTFLRQDRRHLRCAGWKRYVWDSAASSWRFSTQGAGSSVEYVHPAPAVSVKHVWLFAPGHAGTVLTVL